MCVQQRTQTQVRLEISIQKSNDRTLVLLFILRIGQAKVDHWTRMHVRKHGYIIDIFVNHMVFFFDDVVVSILRQIRFHPR